LYKQTNKCDYQNNYCEANSKELAKSQTCLRYN